MSFSDFFKDKNGNIVIAQAPNLPITAWAIVSAVTLLVGDGQLHDSLRWLASALLFVWAYLEASEGESYFRRALGLAVLGYLLVSHFLS